MASQWYYSKDGQQFGPISVQELKQLAASGKLHRNDTVWKEGMKSGTLARKVAGLFPDSPQQSPAPASPTVPPAMPSLSDDAATSPATTPNPPPPPPAIWHLQSADGQRHGPMTKADLDHQYSLGRITAACHIWQSDWPEWKPASEIWPALLNPRAESVRMPEVLGKIQRSITESVQSFLARHDTNHPTLETKQPPEILVDPTENTPKVPASARGAVTAWIMKNKLVAAALVVVAAGSLFATRPKNPNALVNGQAQHASHDEKPAQITKQEFRSKLNSVSDANGRKGNKRESDIYWAVGKPIRTQTVETETYWYWECSDGIIQLVIVNPEYNKYFPGCVQILSCNDY